MESCRPPYTSEQLDCESTCETAAHALAPHPSWRTVIHLTCDNIAALERQLVLRVLSKPPPRKAAKQGSSTTLSALLRAACSTTQ